MGSHIDFNRRLKQYIFGGLSALGLTLIAFALASGHLLDSFILKLVLMLLALVQAAVQLFAFMHIADEKKPRWERFSLLFTVLVMVIIVVGSLWVMLNLNYNMGMTPEQMEQYMLEQNKKGF